MSESHVDPTQTESDFVNERRLARRRRERRTTQMILSLFLAPLVVGGIVYFVYSYVHESRLKAQAERQQVAAQRERERLQEEKARQAAEAERKRVAELDARIQVLTANINDYPPYAEWNVERAQLYFERGQIETGRQDLLRAKDIATQNKLAADAKVKEYHDRYQNLMKKAEPVIAKMTEDVSALTDAIANSPAANSGRERFEAERAKRRASVAMRDAEEALDEANKAKRQAMQYIQQHNAANALIRRIDDILSGMDEDGRDPTPNPHRTNG